MRTIKILNLKINNFKGIKNLSVDFNTAVTNIFGANATGKSTVFDSFTWLLFGKDSQDRKEFEIKNTKTIELNRQDHEVIGLLDVDGEKISLKKIYREKWVKQRGSIEAVYTGNETLYYWNDLPLKQSDYQDRINSLVDEKIFKLITNPLAFNALKWEDRRQVLIDIAGDVSYEDIATGNPKYQDIIAKGARYNNLEEYKKAIAASVKKAKDDLKAIPTRIDEVLKSKPEPLDFDSLRMQLSNKEIELEGVENMILDKQKAFDNYINAQNQKRSRLNELKLRREDLLVSLRKKASAESAPDTTVLENIKSELNSKTSILNSLTFERDSINTNIKRLEKLISDIDKKLIETRDNWYKVGASQLDFHPDNFCCPTCKRDFPEEDVEKRKQNFRITSTEKS